MTTITRSKTSQNSQPAVVTSTSTAARAWFDLLRQRTRARAARGMGQLTVISGPAQSGKTSSLDTAALEEHIATFVATDHGYI